MGWASFRGQSETNNVRAPEGTGPVCGPAGNQRAEGGGRTDARHWVSSGNQRIFRTPSYPQNRTNVTPFCLPVRRHFPSPDRTKSTNVSQRAKHPQLCPKSKPKSNMSSNTQTKKQTEFPNPCPKSKVISKVDFNVDSKMEPKKT